MKAQRKNRVKSASGLLPHRIKKKGDSVIVLGRGLDRTTAYMRAIISNFFLQSPVHYSRSEI